MDSTSSRVDQTFKLPDGRILGYAAYGSPISPNTPLIIYFHGFPGSRIEGEMWLESSLSPKIDATMIAIDRPGMGLSSFQAGRAILDMPSDIFALADHLNIGRFHIMGVSGGSPYVLACVKEIPRSRVISAAVVSGVYPGRRDGMLFKLKALLFVSYWAPTTWMARLFDMQFGTAARDPDYKVMEALLMKEMQGRPEKDLKCLENAELRKSQALSIKEAFTQGAMGPAWDLRLVSDWRFELQEVDGTGITLWHGEADINTPIVMARDAVNALKGCTFHAFPEETHMSVPFNNIEAILRDLLKL